MKPNDPLYGNQWHLTVVGDIEKVWDDYNGAGIHLADYDTGVDFANPDLAGHEDIGRRVVIDGVVQTGEIDPYYAYSNHGTSVAGLLVASANNGLGVVGAAWGASLTSVNVYSDQAETWLGNSAGYLSGIHQGTNFDVINMEVQPAKGFYSAYNLADPDSMTAKIAAEYAFISANGRGGLGTVIVQAGGNYNFDLGQGGVGLSRYTVTVAAALQSGFATSYSNFGAGVLVTAPGSDLSGSIVTTDISGNGGYAAGDYNFGFNGTSAATPQVAAIVALMLDANPDIGWRDAQAILAASATHTGSAIGSQAPGTNENGTWAFNGATGWNGGGAHFSVDYGYGMVNAFNAARMAEAWSLFGAAKTSANEAQVDTGTIAVGKAIGDAATTTFKFKVTSDLAIEGVDLTLKLTHQNFSQLSFVLVSPDGTRMQATCADGGTAFADNGLTWQWNFEGYRGELAAGKWKLVMSDNGAGEAGTLDSIKLVAHGSALAVNSVFHYTDEFSDMVALAGQEGRRTLADKDGGTDWIDAAAVTSGSKVNLTAGTATIDGVALTVSGIENAVAGDGKDSLKGDGGANKLVGMRGDDALSGEGGDDRLEGGRGADVLKGGGGIDTASYSTATKGLRASLADATGNSGDAKGDTYSSIENLTGSSQGDNLAGDASDNVLAGGLGKDTLTGGAGADAFLFNAKLGSKNVDTLTDFSHADDVFKLDHDIFKGLAKGMLALEAFFPGTQAAGKEDRILYDKTHGDLFFDQDGTKSGYEAVQFAHLADSHGKFPGLDNTDFLVV